MQRDPDIRCSRSALQDPSNLAFIWDDSYVRLNHIADLLESENIIEHYTANRIRQCALDFKVCLERLQDLADSDKDVDVQL